VNLDFFGRQVFLGQTTMVAPPGSKTPPVSAEDAYRIRDEDPAQWGRLMDRMNDAQKCYLFMQMFAIYGRGTDEWFANGYCDYAGIKRAQVWREMKLPTDPTGTPTTPRRSGATPTGTPTGGVRPATTTPIGPYGKTPEGNVIFAPRPPRAQTTPSGYPSTPTAGTIPTVPLPRYTDVPPPSTPSYGTDLQRQIDSYEAKLREVYGTTTPTQTTAATPTPAYAESALEACPPGQFRRPSGGPCVPWTPTGGLPGITGGLTAASVAPLIPTGASSFSMLGRPIKVKNLA
jgi:hypothetical protein